MYIHALPHPQLFRLGSSLQFQRDTIYWTAKLLVVLQAYEVHASRGTLVILLESLVHVVRGSGHVVIIFHLGLEKLTKTKEDAWICYLDSCVHVQHSVVMIRKPRSLVELYSFQNL